MTELIFLSRIMDYDGGSRGTIYFWPGKVGSSLCGPVCEP